MKKKEQKQVPNISIRISSEAVHKAKIEAVKQNITIGEWLEAAIEEKIMKENALNNEEA